MYNLILLNMEYRIIFQWTSVFFFFRMNSDLIDFNSERVYLSTYSIVTKELRTNQKKKLHIAEVTCWRNEKIQMKWDRAQFSNKQELKNEKINKRRHDR